MTEECDHKRHKVVCPSSAGPCCEGCGEPWPYEDDVKSPQRTLEVTDQKCEAYQTNRDLRDYFAAKAMAAIIAKTTDYTPYDKTAISAYDYADAMVAARGK